MSGGYFNYEQYKIDYIADQVEHLITSRINNDDIDSDSYSYNFSPETLKQFKEGLNFLKIAAIYTQRIDWLVSGDDGEDTFHLRLASDLEKLKNE